MQLCYCHFIATPMCKPPFCWLRSNTISSSVQAEPAILQSVSYRRVFSDITGALLLRKKHCSLVHVGSSMIFVAGRSQLLVELNAHRALQRRHVVAISLLVLKPCRHTHLSVALCDPLLNSFHRYPSLLCRWNLVRASCTLLSWHFVHTRTRLIGHMA